MRHFLEQQMPKFEGDFLHFNNKDRSSKLFILKFKPFLQLAAYNTHVCAQMAQKSMLQNVHSMIVRASDKVCASSEHVLLCGISQN